MNYEKKTFLENKLTILSYNNKSYLLKPKILTTFVAETPSICILPTHTGSTKIFNEYYLNPKFHKILSRAFWVIAILRFFPYVARVDFKGLISK